ncbi:MAG: ParB N-terminal domain-containing protein, partial [Sulfobacillus sp.]|nr:ParB N-terminal domain-containing protein [Sulfobacillus sp.]
MSTMDPKRLKPHPANALFDPLPDEVYQALKDDIAARGMLNPILCTPDYTVIAGHHRLKAALELGLETVPVDIHDVDAEEAEDRLIADNVLRRQLNPMEQARLIRRLKERYGIKKGNNQRAGGSVKFTDAVQAVGIAPETAYQLDRLNKLIPPLQELVSAGKLGPSHGVALASLTPEQQTALYDAIGEAITHLQLADIKAAKKGPDTRALEARITALEAERDALQQRLVEIHATAQDTMETDTLIASLQRQLAEAEAARQAAADEVARLKAQTPVERLVEKVVTVEKPVPDPAQTERIAALEQALAAAQSELAVTQRQIADAAHVAELETRRAALEAEVAALQSDVSALTTQRDQAEAAWLTVIQTVEEAFRTAETAWAAVEAQPFPLSSSLQNRLQAVGALFDLWRTRLRLWLGQTAAESEPAPPAAKRSRRRPSKPETPSADDPALALVKRHAAQYHARIGQPLAVSWARDVKIYKDLLKLYDVALLEQCQDRYFALPA